MPRTLSLTRAVTVALATTALAAPAAVAQPIDPTGTQTTPPGADLRSEATKPIESTGTQITPPAADLRSEAAKDVTNDALRPLPGPPSFPKYVPPTSTSHATADDGDETPWVTIGLGIAGAGLLAAGAAGAAGLTHRRTRDARLPA